MLQMEEKLEKLKAYLKKCGSTAIAFSGGVDSTFLLYVAHEVLKDQVLAVTATPASFPEEEVKATIEFAKKYGIRHRVIDFDEFSVKGFSSNPRNRCYLCKKALMHKIKLIAIEEKMACVVEGSNLDDLLDYRPGMNAILELEIKSPLQHSDLSKEEIRLLSKKWNLPTWEKPSLACLATRFAYGETITREKIAMVGEAEKTIFSLGFKQVRVRVHKDLARIELLPEEMPRFMEDEIRSLISKKLSELGFRYVSLDLAGYRTGSMN